MSSIGAPSMMSPNSLNLWYSSVVHRFNIGPKPRLPVTMAGASIIPVESFKSVAITPLCLRRLDHNKFVLLRHLPNILRDLHRAVFRTAHAAKMGRFERVFRQRLVVIGPCRFRVEREAKLLVP